MEIISLMQIDVYLKEGEMDGNYISNVDRQIFRYCLMNEILMFIFFKIHYSQTCGFATKVTYAFLLQKQVGGNYYN